MNDAGQRPDVGNDVARRNASHGSWQWRMELMNPEAIATTNAHEMLAGATARGTRATVWGIVATSLLPARKISGRILGNFYALIADGIESMLDIMNARIVCGSLRVSTQPAEEEYPYGYGNVECETRTPHPKPAGFTLVMMVGVVITKECMFRLLFRAGKTVGSTSMQTCAPSRTLSRALSRSKSVESEKAGSECSSTFMLSLMAT